MLPITGAVSYMLSLALQVSVVDLSEPEATVAARVREACLSSGFFYVVNHGISEALVTEVFEQNHAFFALPAEQKRYILADCNNRGYTPMAEETLDPANQREGDTKEGLYFGREVAPGSPEAHLPLHGPNQWPPEDLLPRYREVTEAYLAALLALSFRLLRALAIALDLAPEHFRPYFDPPSPFLRPLRYAARASAPEQGVFGAGAHSDYGMLTLLRTDDAPGLQVRPEPGGSWHPVAPRPGAFIVNLGDMLERWTNGLFRSTLHRVCTAGDRDRYSIAFFFDPAFSARVECLPTCCSDTRPAKFPPTTSGEYLLGRYAATHSGYDAGAKGGGGLPGGQ
ncbi:hypothetical protein WJX81_000832 [Elliptochloris bilobata]|uniref:Fe2OG dioxygenase domain-containing protein n=1 Tax=Elliptochloris bilobata TaxID=381761 RepID=A0AAW1SAZ9_9CHLO